MASDPEATCESDPPALFIAAGIELPLQAGPTAAEKVAAYFQSGRVRRFLLLNLCDADHYRPSRQLRLALTQPPLPSTPRAEWLDYGVYDVFRDIECAQAPALALEARGYYRIGRLLELSEGRLARSRFMSRTALEAMKARLASAGLQLGRCMAREATAPAGPLRQFTVVR
jgi:hypothetical protein